MRCLFNYEIKTDLTKILVQVKDFYTKNVYYELRQLLRFTAVKIIKLRFCNTDKNVVINLLKKFF